MSGEMRHGVYYSARRDVLCGGWRAVTAIYDHGRRMWHKSHGLPLTTEADALERAEFEANSYADTNVPRPHVAALFPKEG